MTAKALFSFMCLFLILGAAAVAHTEDRLIYVINTPLTGELNSLKAIARELHGTVKVVDAETLQLQTLVPSLILHALGNPEEIEDLVEYKARYPNVSMINLHDPVTHREAFRSVLIGSHADHVPGRNVVYFDGTPSQVTIEALEALQHQHFETSVTGELTVSVLIGGTSKGAIFTQRHAVRLAETLNQIRKNQHVRFLISNSRRTSDEATSAFQNALTSAPRDRFIDWRETANPYLEMLAASDRIVVTGDSMSMIADALKTGKPTFVYAPEGSLEERHKKFVLAQAKAGRIRPLGTTLPAYTYEPPDTSTQIVSILETRGLLPWRARVSFTCESLFK